MIFNEQSIMIYIFVLIFGAFLGALANTSILQWLSEEIPKEIIKDSLDGNENVEEKTKNIPQYRRKWFEYIPVLSWIKRDVSLFSYFPKHKQIALEVAFSSATLLLFISFGLSKEFLLHTFAFWYFTCGMICDIKTRYCPPTLQAIGFVGCVASALFINGIMPTLLGLVLPGLVLYAIVVAFEMFLGKEVMGGGDLKMIVIVGGLLGSGFAIYEIAVGALIVTVLYVGVAIRYRRKGENYPVPMMVGYALAFVLYEALRFTEEGKAFFEILSSI